ncbi:MAG: FkbM family methyltransferase [Candidatus Bathyarchaeia archaeon]
MDFYQTYIERPMGSLVNVGATRKDKDVLLKSLTLMNLAKKFAGSSLRLTYWRFGNCVVRVKFMGDNFWFCLPRGTDFNIFLNPYFHEYDITRWVFRILSSGDVFLDVGAHGGLYTVLAGRRVKETGIVLSFEPNPLNFGFLKYNVRLNNLGNVYLISKAAGDESGKIRLFYSAHETALTSSKKTGGESFESEVTTVDEAAAELSLVKIMKIDTEGNDLNVLIGAVKTLQKTCFVIVEQNTSSVRKLLSDAGFQLSNLKPSGYLLAKQ